MVVTVQHLRALERANEVRAGRSALRREMVAGELGIGAALRDPRAQGIEVLALLMTRRQIGRELARTALRRASVLDGGVALYIRENIPVGRLTERQKTRIAESVPEWAR